MINRKLNIKRVIPCAFLLLGFVVLFSIGGETVSADPWPNTTNQNAQWTQPNSNQNQWNQPTNNQWDQPQQQSEWEQPTTTPASSTTAIQVTNDTRLSSPKRLGVNLGWYDQYGSGQYLKNLIPNPGLEAGEFAMILLVGPGSSSERIRPNKWYPPKSAQQEGFWSGGEWEIISGEGRGRHGAINEFRWEGGNYTFYLNGNKFTPSVGDAMIVRKQVQGYFTETPTRFIQPEFDDKRPGSPGAQSLRVNESGWQPGFYIPFDSFSRDGDNTNTAGKMRIVEGRWHVELWVKATEPGQTVELKFHRVREKVFYQEIIPLTDRWQKIERRFYVAPGTDPMVKQNANPINFEVRIASGDGDILIDDMELMRLDQSNPTEFTDNFVDRMKELNPGIVRYWGRQLGSSLDNQIAEPWARRTTGYDPHEGEPLAYNYTLHEFLEFARHIGAEPWYVVPPTFTADELTSLVAYLSAPAGTHWAADRRAELGMHTPWTSVFPNIHLEYGNEMWGGNTGGDPFRGASVWNGIQLGDVANDRLGIMKSSPFYDHEKLNLIIGGQAGYPGRQSEISQTAFTHDAIALAPYYGAETRAYNTPASLYQPLFANPTYNVAQHGKMYQNRQNVPESKELMIYEINSHFTTGGMPPKQRDQFVTSMGSGVAHALHMLTYQAELGVRNQAAFTATQFSFQIPGRGGQRVSLWGMLIDSEATGRKRPTWLGMELVNRAIKGNMVETVQSGINPSWKQRPINGIGQQTEVDTIQSFAFKQGGKYSVVVFNLDIYKKHTVEFEVPGNPRARATLHKMTAPNINSNNEREEVISIETESFNMHQGATLELEPHSIYVIEFESY